MTKRRDMTTICLVSTIAVLFGVLLYFVCKCKFTEKYNSNKKLPMKVQPKQQVSTDTYNKITDLIKLSTMKDTSTIFPQSNMFNSKVLNHRIVLVQKVFEMLNGRVDRLVKLGEKYPNVKPSDKVKPQEMQVEINKIRSIVKKIPIFQKHDYTKVFTRGIDPKSKEYTSLYYLGMKANDNIYKTNLCSKDKQCMKVLERLTKVSKKREEVLKDVSIKYNKGLVSKETFDLGLSDTPAEGKQSNCYWRILEGEPVSYGNFCGPSGNIRKKEEKTGGPCDALDSCCYDHDISYGECQRAGDWCLQNAGVGYVGLGVCTSSLCVASADAQLCQCAITTLGTTISTLGLLDEVSIGSWSGLLYSSLQITIFCNEYRWMISLIIGTIYVIVDWIILIVELIIDIALWVWDLLGDLADWFGDKWDDFLDWWNDEDKKLRQEEGEPATATETQRAMLTAVVSEEGTAIDQVTRITDQITKLFDTNPTRRVGMGCPTRRECGSCCIERQNNETDLQHKSRLACCLRSPDDTDYRNLKPKVKPLPKPKIPLKPPNGSGGGGIVPGVSPVIARYCDKNSEIIIQENGRRTTLRGDNVCCTTECVEDTWHKKCGTSQTDFASVSSRLPNEVWSNSYLSDENLGMSCSQPQPCFMRDGRMYECGNPPTSGGSGGGGGDGSEGGTVRPNLPRF